MYHEKDRNQVNVTHEITSMVRKVNKHGDPMWECQCKTGEKVWVNKHTDPLKDKFVHFVAAGFEPVMAAMVEGQRIEWKQFPIRVEMTKDGDFWRLLAVAERAEGQTFDVPYAPSREYWKRKAVEYCQILCSITLACWDTETTGFDGQAEIISLGCVDADLTTRVARLVQPMNMDRVALTNNVHGIAREQLKTVEDFGAQYNDFRFILHGGTWLGYNLKFDAQMLDMECDRRALPAILSYAVYDAMELVSWYRGEWDEANARWKVCKLTEAAEALGVEYHGEAHDALNDAITTMMLVRMMAGVA